MIQNNIQIQFASATDAQKIIDYNRAMAQETEGKELSLELITEGVNRLLSDETLGFYAVAKNGDEVVACLMVTTEWSDWRNGVFWWIQSVYVSKDYRRKGIYKKMYQFVKEEASKTSRVCGFRLYVEKENVIAQKTYEALGMEETVYKLYEELK